MAVLEGFLVGAGMVIFIGPVFFTLLKTSLNYGLWAGLSVAAGIFVSDVVCVALCSLGAVPFFKDPDNQFYLAVGGGVILLALGFRYIFRANLPADDKVKLNAGHYSTYFAKGFLVNFLNPFVFLVWIGVIGLAQSRYGTGTRMWLYLLAALFAILLTDSLKVVFAHRVKRLIRPAFLSRAYQIIGIVLIGFGARLLWFAFVSTV